MASDDFYVINSWMIDDLGLSGTELHCFAIIWSLSRGKKQMYIAGNSHLVKMTKMTEHTIITTLKSLCEKGYIKKIPTKVNNVARNYYKAITKGCKNFSDEESQNDKRGCNNYSGTTEKISAPNKESNNESNNKENKLSNDNSKSAYSDDFLEFWEAYGYYRDKGIAYKRWKNLSKKDKAAALKALPEYFADCKRCDRKKRYPAVYLSKRTWEDDFSNQEKEEDSAEEKTLYPEGMDAEQWNEITMWMCEKVPLIAGKIDPISFGQMKDMAGDSKLFSELLKQVNEDFSLDSSHSVKSVFYKRLKEYRNGQKG